MMEQRIQQVFQRLTELLTDKRPKSAVDIDLMLDYARVLYADLLEVRKTVPQGESVPAPAPVSTPAAAVSAGQQPENAEPAALATTATEPTIHTSGVSFEDTKSTKKEDPEVIEETVEALQKDPGSAIAYEPPTITREPKKIEESIVEEAPEAPMPEPLVIRTEDIPPAAVKQGKDVRNAIGINDKYLFLNELFNNHKTEYENALDNINRFAGLEEALDWVKTKSATKSVWDEDNGTVQNFIAVLQKHFAATR